MNHNQTNSIAGKTFRKSVQLALGLALVMAPLLFIAQPAAAQTPAIVRCDPSTTTGEVGEQFFVDMYIENVANLYGVQLRVSFDPTKVQAVDMDNIFPGIQILPLVTWLVPGFIVEREADNTLGSIDYSMTQLDPQPPANGSGGVARIVFEGIQAGTFPMVWDTSYVLLSAPAGVPIPSTTQDCSVTVTEDPTSVSFRSLSATEYRGSQVMAIGGSVLALSLITLFAGLFISLRSRRRQ